MREVDDVGREYVVFLLLGFYSVDNGELKNVCKYFFESIFCIERGVEKF